MEDFTALMHCKNGIDVIYMDSLKTFDSEPHETLTTKVETFWVDTICTLRTKSTQRVVVVDGISDFRTVIVESLTVVFWVRPSSFRTLMIFHSSLTVQVKLLPMIQKCIHLQGIGETS